MKFGASRSQSLVFQAARASLASVFAAARVSLASRAIVAAFAGLMVLIAPSAGLAADTLPVLSPTKGRGREYVKIASTIKLSELQKTVSDLAALPSRIPGYPGYERAANYVQNAMSGAGLSKVHRENFTVAIPVEDGTSTLTVGGHPFRVYPLWPNQVRTSQLPPGGITAPLIDGGSGKLTAFDDRQVQGSIVLLDFNSAADWLNAPRLGAKAVIFIEPVQMLRGEAETKWVQLPLQIPRFFISRADGAVLRAMARGSVQGALPNVNLQCSMRWKNVQGHNIVGIIPGVSSDPAVRRQEIVVESYYDDMSTVPTLSPGAESATGIATFLALARTYVKHPPARTVLFIADGAHFEALTGIRQYLEAHFSKLEGPPMGQRFRTWVGTNSIWIFIVLVVIFGLGIYSSLQRVMGWGAPEGEAPHVPTRVDRVVLGIWIGIAAVVWAALLAITPNHAFPVPAPAPKDTHNRWYAFTALDLSSRNQQVGVFYKGMFYDMREDIQRNFSDFARSIRENVQQIAPLIGEDKDKNFADGVNPISGKSWRNFIPGKLALDNEPVTMAGGIGVGFVTTSDTRPFVDTPSDTIDRLRMDNILKQAKLLSCIYYDIFNDSNQPDKNGEIKLPLTQPANFGRMNLQGGFATLYGRIVKYVPTKSFVPNTPIPGSLAILVNGNQSLTGVRGDDIELVPHNGHFNFIGVAPLTAYGYNRSTDLEGYHLDADGNIDYAPDQGVNGAQNYPISIQMTVAQKEATVVLFRCASVSMYGLVDPQSMTLLTDLNLYDAQTDSNPQRYGVSTAHLESWQNFVEPVAILFADPGSSIKVVMGSGPIATRLVMVNFTPWMPRFDKADQQPVLAALRNGASPESLMKKYSAADQVDQQKLLDQYQLLKQWMIDHPDAPDRDFLVGKQLPQYAAAIRSAWLKADVHSWVFGPANEWDPLRHGSVKHADDGDGYKVTTSSTIPATAYKAATDMFWLDNSRIDLLAKYRIINQGLDKLHTDTGRELVAATAALQQLNYDRFDSYSRAAWGFESRAYPSVMETAQDVVKGVLFYLFLLLPFAYFVERLLFGKPDLRQQLAFGFAIFLAIFLILYEVHPAFEISKNPVIVLLAFIMLALGLLVIFLVIGKFEEQLKQYQKSVGGIHKADIGRMSVALAAFSLGISQMRKRRARTALTCITLILLTFTVLSFTSVVSDIAFNKIPTGEKPSYYGLLVRSPNWDQLQESAFDTLYDEFAARRAVAPRAWFYTNATSDQSFVTVGTNKNDNTYDAKAVLGLSPQEKDVTHVDKAVAYGGWLQPNDPYEAIIPEGMAKALDLTPADVGKAKVRFNGLDLTLTGILSNARFKTIKDLDQESLAPVDFIQMQRQQQQTGGAGQQQQSQQGFQQYIHLEPDQMMIVPYQTLQDLGGGGLRSVAIDFIAPNEVENVLENLMPRLDLNLYAGLKDQVYRYSSIGRTSVSGIFDLLFPILIAACIVLNTMLGSVFERIKEIHIFSSIGLAPNHVAMLFLAESFVYSIIGAVLGYVLGQSVTKLISTYHLLEGLSLNFSSVSGVLSTILVVAVVMLSTLYPARKASQVATPSIDRTWRVPEPDGDDWTIPMPFSVTGDQAIAMGAFLTEWFKAYEEYSIGDFVTQNVATYEFDSPLGRAYSIKLMAWLAPFDLGVSQKVELQTIPSDMQDVYELRLVVHRESGDVSNWKRVNRRFLNTLRKQFLIWRTLRTEERERYLMREEETPALQA
ncbi:MAG TPA: FtsX-like permease family protein [Armatimonadota bacterium]|nr:FtsX-like permease family protein [Armatimonadota bacterium]